MDAPCFCWACLLHLIPLPAPAHFSELQRQRDAAEAALLLYCLVEEPDPLSAGVYRIV
jgi:hypothetical protein